MIWSCNVYLFLFQNMDEEIPDPFFKQLRVKLRRIDDIETAINPVAEFLHYCCPECAYQTKELEHFGDYARLKHVQSKTLFKPEKTTLSESDFKEELICVKEELLNEDFDDSEITKICTC